MGAQEYVTQRSTQIDQGKTDVLSAIDKVHKTQRVILGLRQTAQIERLRETDAALRVTMEDNVSELGLLEEAFNAIVGTLEKLPTTFAGVDAAEQRLEAALPSTS